MLEIRSVAIAALFLFTTFSSIALAEHPSEHPAGEQSKVTTETIAKAIEKHVKKESKKSEGYLIVEDEVAKKKLYLKLDKIHMERLSAVEKDLYFACVDFTNKDGQSFDIDFFLKDSQSGLKVRDTIVHKEGGKPRYNWEKKGNYWIRKPVE